MTKFKSDLKNLKPNDIIGQLLDGRREEGGDASGEDPEGEKKDE